MILYQLGGNESITHLLHRQLQLSIKTTGRPRSKKEEAMVKTNLSRYVGSSLVTSEKILMFVYFFCMQRVLIIQ